MRNLSQDSRCPDRDNKPTRLEHQVAMLNTVLTHSMLFEMYKNRDIFVMNLTDHEERLRMTKT